MGHLGKGTQASQVTVVGGCPSGCGHPRPRGVPHPVEKGHWIKARTGALWPGSKRKKASNRGPSAEGTLEEWGFSCYLNTRQTKSTEPGVGATLEVEDATPMAAHGALQGGGQGSWHRQATPPKSLEAQPHLRQPPHHPNKQAKGTNRPLLPLTPAGPNARDSGTAGRLRLEHTSFTLAHSTWKALFHFGSVPNAKGRPCVL